MYWAELYWAELGEPGTDAIRGDILTGRAVDADVARLLGTGRTLGEGYRWEEYQYQESETAAEPEGHSYRSMAGVVR